MGGVCSCFYYKFLYSYYRASYLSMCFMMFLFEIFLMRVLYSIIYLKVLYKIVFFLKNIVHNFSIFKTSYNKPSHLMPYSSLLGLIKFDMIRQHDSKPTRNLWVLVKFVSTHLINKLFCAKPVDLKFDPLIIQFEPSKFHNKS